MKIPNLYLIKVNTYLSCTTYSFILRVGNYTRAVVLNQDNMSPKGVGVTRNPWGKE